MTDPEATHGVEIEAAETTVRAGDAADVTATVTSEGPEPDDVTVELAVDGEAVTSEDVELDDGGTRTVDLEWTPDPDAVGTVELAVSTGTDTATETVTVEDAPAEFAVSIDSADEHVSAGGTATVAAEITNEGTLEDTQDVELRADDEPVDSHRLQLDGQERDTATFDHEVTEEDAPETTLAVTTEDDEDETSVPVVTETVTPLRKLGSKGGMGVFGWLMFAGMLILLVPLLPLLVLVKLVDMLFGRADPAS